MDPITIFEDLKQKIIWLEIIPGTTMNLVELAQQYQVSRTPIAIALARLHAEEWVSKHGSHYVVDLLTVDRMRDITELRTVLEQEAARWAMERMTRAGQQELEELRKLMLAMEDGASKREVVELDFRFHKVIYRQTQNQYLVTVIERMLCHYMRFWLSRPKPIDPQEFFQDNLAIMEGLLDKDPEKLDQAVRRHIKASLEVIIRL